MKAKFFFIAIVIFSITFAQGIDTRSTRSNAYGSIKLRRYHVGDTTWKRALTPYRNVLNINMNSDFRYGVTIFGPKIRLLGKVGIGTRTPDEMLTVNGKIHAKEVKIDLQVPADYVFQKYFTGNSDLKEDYEMLPFKDLESYLKENNHLPGVPSAKEIQDNGLLLGEMNNILLEKIEELTLYTIEQQKAIDALKEEVLLLKNENSSK